MPGLGAGSPWSMLWAKAATHYGRLIFRTNGAQRFKHVSYVEHYVGLVLNRRKIMSLRTIGVNLFTSFRVFLTLEHSHISFEFVCCRCK